MSINPCRHVDGRPQRFSRQEVGVEVVQEGVGVHHLKGVGGEVRFQEGVERVSSHGFLEQAKEEVPFVVGNGRHAIVGVTVFQVQAQVRVAGVDVHDGVDLVHEALVAQGAQHFTDVTSIDGFHDALFEIHGEAFVEPKIVPCGVGHEVSAPAVCQFVGDQTHQAAVARDDGGGGEGQTRVLHPAKRKRCGQHQKVVAFPGVGTVEVLGCDEHVFHLGEFVLGRIDQVGSGVHACVGPNAPEFHIAHGHGQEVRRDGLVHLEVVASVRRLLGGVDRTHQGHQRRGHFDVRAVGEAHPRAVLAGNPGSGQDGLALGEQKRRVALDPQERTCIR